MMERALSFAEVGLVALNQLVILVGDHNSIMREQNQLLERIAAATELEARNNPLYQIEQILAAAAPEETMR